MMVKKAATAFDCRLCIRAISFANAAMGEALPIFFEGEGAH
jgi:hypothetical protein